MRSLAYRNFAFILSLGTLSLACKPDAGGSSGSDTSTETATETTGDPTGSTGATGSTGEPPSVQDQCGAPAPCEEYSVDPGTNMGEVHPGLECAIGKALESIKSGTPVSLTSSFCDIGCSGTDLVLVGDGTAYRQYWSSTDVVDYEPIERCKLQPASFFEPCVGQPIESNGCSSLSDWMTACEQVPAATCP